MVIVASAVPDVFFTLSQPILMHLNTLFTTAQVSVVLLIPVEMIAITCFQLDLFSFSCLDQTQKIICFCVHTDRGIEVDQESCYDELCCLHIYY